MGLDGMRGGGSLFPGLFGDGTEPEPKEKPEEGGRERVSCKEPVDEVENHELRHRGEGGDRIWGVREGVDV